MKLMIAYSHTLGFTGVCGHYYLSKTIIVRLGTMHLASAAANFRNMVCIKTERHLCHYVVVTCVCVY